MMQIEDFDPQNIDDDPGVVTRKNLPQFKGLYEKAIAQGISNFRFHNRTVSTVEAEYILKNMGAFR